MGFIAKGEEIILQPGGSSTETRSYFYRREKQDGTFEDVSWGSQAVDFDTPIVNSTWASYDSYKYIALGVTKKTYNEVYHFNRNSRVDTNIKVSNDVLPLNHVYAIDYITAVIPGSQDASIELLAPKIIDEYYSGLYQDVIAAGMLYQNIPDNRPVNIDVNDVKEYKGTAESKQDYNLPTTQALYLVNLAVVTNSMMEQLNSLSINLYKQEFIEFLGDNTITPGTVGKTQINPSYLPENAINNKVIVITEDMLVDDGNGGTMTFQSFLLVLAMIFPLLSRSLNA